MEPYTDGTQSVISQNHPTEGLEFKDFKIQIYFWLNKIRSVDFLQQNT